MDYNSLRIFNGEKKMKLENLTNKELEELVSEIGILIKEIKKEVSRRSEF